MTSLQHANMPSSYNAIKHSSKEISMKELIEKEQALNEATRSGDRKIVRGLLKEADISAERNGKLLIEAATNGRFNFVCRLLKHAIISTEDKGWALKIASNKRHFDIVERLLKERDVLINTKGWALNEAVKNRNLKEVERLLAEDAQAPETEKLPLAKKETALILASEYGYLEIAEKLLKEKGNYQI